MYFYCRIIQGYTCNKSTPFIHKIHIILIKSNGSVLTNRLNLIKGMIEKIGTSKHSWHSRNNGTNIYTILNRWGFYISCKSLYA